MDFIIFVWKVYKSFASFATPLISQLDGAPGYLIFSFKILQSADGKRIF
jgi:hypothetical protein